MFSIKLLILVVLIGVTLCDKCSLIDNDVLIIIAKPNELMKYSINSFFNTIDSNAIQIVDDLKITKLVPSLQLLQKANYIANIPNIISVKVLKQDTDQWLNRFVILDKQPTNYNVQLSNLKQGQDYRLPILTQGMFNVANDLLTCYDLDFLNQDTIIIDCSQQGDQGAPLSNIIINLSLEDNIVRTEYLGLNPMNYVVTPKRFVSTQNGFIFRGYAYEGLGELSVIEILYFDEGQFKLQETIDSAALAVLLNLQNYEFKLIEMRSSQKYISILNSNGDILILEFRPATKELRLVYTKSFGKMLTKFEVNYDRVDYIYGADNQNIYFSQGQEVGQIAIDMTTSTMHLTKNYLLVTSTNKIIQFDMLSMKKIYEIENINQYILSDFLQNDFVIFGMQNIQRYNGKMQPEIEISYDKTVTKNVIRLTYNDCELQLFYYCIEEDSAEVFNTRNPSEFLQSDVTIRSTQLTSKQIFEGPNLQYYTSPLTADSVKYTVEQFNILRQDFDLQKVRYVTSLLDWNYIFYQTEDLKGYLLRCNKFTCDPYRSFQFDNVLNDQNCFWATNLHLTFYYMADKEVRQYRVLQDPMTPTAVFAKSEYVSTQMIQLDKSTFLLLEQNEHIVRQQDIDLVDYNLFALTPTTATQFGIIDWNPTKLFGNLASDVFVVESNEQLYVFKFQLFQIWQLLITIPFKYTNVPVDVAIFEKYIVVITQQMKINVYNIEDQTNIYLQKSINAYKYRFADKIQMTYSYSNNLFYVNVVDENQTPKVVVFSADKISHSAIIQVFDVSTPNVVISSLYDQFLLIDNKTLQRMKYHSDYYIPIEFTKISESYCNKVNQLIKVKNFSWNNVKQFEQHFKILNDQREIKINKENINQGKDQFEVSESADNKCMELSSDWYKGQVESVTAVCPQCDKGNVVFQGYIQQIQKKALDQSQDIVDFNDSELVQLTGMNLFVVSKFDLSFSIIHLDQICQMIRPLKNTIFMMCNDVENKNLFIGYQIGPQQSTKLGTLIFDEEIRDFRVFNHYLFIEFESSIKIYYFEQGIDDIEKGQLIGSYTQVNQVFEVVRLRDNIYHLSFINNQQLYYYELTVNQDKIQETNKFTIDLYKLILDDLDGYVATNTVFNGMICNYYDPKDSKVLQYLFTTSNVAQYVIQFRISEATTNIQMISMLSPLGDYQIEGYPKLQVYENYVIIPYSKNKQQRLSLYNLKDKPQEQGLPTYMRGAIKNNGLTATTLIYGFNGNIYLLAEDEEQRTYDEYKLFENMQLCMNKGIVKQTFYFQLSNSFTNNELNLGIELLIEKSSSLWWLWLILGLVCATAIGFGAYCYIKKRKAKVEDRLIT